MNKINQRERRKKRIRAKIFGTTLRPRLSVFRSATNVYAQLIDDQKGKTLAFADSRKEGKKKSNLEKAKNVGMEIAKKASEKKIKKVVFDRRGYKYHGKIKALAEGAREGGLAF